MCIFLLINNLRRSTSSTALQTAKTKKYFGATPHKDKVFLEEEKETGASEWRRLPLSRTEGGERKLESAPWRTEAIERAEGNRGLIAKAAVRR